MARPLILTLEKLIKLHSSLLDLSQRKTEIIKKGDVNGLDQFLKDEQKHIAAINTMEMERQKQATFFLKERGKAGTNPTISQCIEVANDDDKNELTRLQKQLLMIIDELKTANELNQKLIYQSLQYVNMSLSMIHPQNDQGNYGRPDQERKPTSQRSIIDSRA
ncbi:flagellar biosynthesis/type III secretory pathway chaperone [Bacillus pakistanensis]|uniref:Flagellar biosynthesis/type III secretory pathway chaperone n=1 Tax=Rossellomorea pakistanensis TaxID=992288 RepID=A0ABS2NDC8_9BACI|nr:flagellar protein FlgN [Bacillus pakistanensis]MBM7585869.1 flagellar biosynthesis/type III secretory pathway chaperone [Bacillus pakistanensis]